MKLLNQMAKRSTGTVLLVACILCSITMSLADFCPEDARDNCRNIASILNCVLCIVVLAKTFGYMN